jgi:hypothetical protein
MPIIPQPDAPCTICGQVYPINQLNGAGECINCGTTLKLFPPGSGALKPKGAYGKICTKCQIPYREHVLFNIKEFCCPKCGQKPTAKEQG